MSAGTPYLERVAHDVLAYVQPDGSWMINNAGAVVGPDGVLLVDTSSTEGRTRGLLSAVAAESGGRPVRTLVNTHHHADHTFGNCLVEGAVRVGHELTRRGVLESGLSTQALFPDVDYGAVQPAPPEVTFAATLSLHVGDLEARCRYVGPAHTPDDVYVWLPERGVVFAGDLVFAGGTPFLLMGSVAGYPAALQALRDLEPEVLVPGHGPVRRGDEVPAALDDMAAYVAWLADYAAEAHAAGWQPLEAARRADLGRFAQWGESERVVGNLARAYAERDGAPPGAPIDTLAAVLAMREYAGGTIHCYA